MQFLPEITGLRWMGCGKTIQSWCDVLIGLAVGTLFRLPTLSTGLPACAPRLRCRMPEGLAMGAARAAAGWKKRCLKKIACCLSCSWYDPRRSYGCAEGQQNERCADRQRGNSIDQLPGRTASRPRFRENVIAASGKPFDTGEIDLQSGLHFNVKSRSRLAASRETARAYRACFAAIPSASLRCESKTVLWTIRRLLQNPVGFCASGAFSPLLCDSRYSSGSAAAALNFQERINCGRWQAIWVVVWCAQVLCLLGPRGLA